MLIPSEGRQVWSLNVPKILIPAVLVCALLFVGLLAGSAAVLINSADVNFDRARLTEENELLKSRLSGMEGTIDGLMASVERNAEFQRRARILANIDDAADEPRKMGIGGPVFAANDPLARYDSQSASLVLDFEDRLEELEGQCGHHEQNFGEILNRLEDQKERWECTPSITPVPNGWPSSGFGKRQDPFTGVPRTHLGLDFSAPRGSLIYATADGTVISSGWHHEYGRCIEIDHGNGVVTKYAHNDKLKVKRGQKVTRGQVVATVGRSGRATAPHVHYEVRVNGAPVNPWKYILSSEVVVD
jgi:murein DD-endopeptidase MepM/ murein hydrolase activator NlpD